MENFDSEIAIIGMTGRFPGARNLDEFWQNLCQGVESITFFSDEELASCGIDPADLGAPNYVKAGAILEDIEWFDAPFFGFSTREAEITDPQQRLFLECAWEVLENAGYDAEMFAGLIGVYAGVGANSYLLNNLFASPTPLKSITRLQFLIGNDKDHLATRVSYKLNLRGPSVTVQTTCSTALVATHLAYQSLLNGECDLALAGGVNIQVPQKAGYFYSEGGIQSPDGRCRAFDAEAQGTVGGNGVGIVVLKRLEEALADGDCIHAVVKGSAINNDGSLKIGYTAPSVDGQAEVIASAFHMARVEPETITYLEAHGTATPMGDPIEIAALTQAFRASTTKKDFCAIGSVKSNIGHLNTAAGIASLIKTVLALEHGVIPPSLNFQRPNPKIDFANSPFYVNTTLSEWKTGGTPRRAGVSSFGIGGTNAHIVLEQAPRIEPSGASRPCQLLVLSAQTSSALETATTRLAKHFEQHPDLNLADVAYTLQVGRRAFDHRRMLVCRDLDDAVTALKSMDPQRVFTRFQTLRERPVTFMFPGQGTQYVNMALELYQTERTFRDQVALCSRLLEPHLGLDLCTLVYPTAQKATEATWQLNQTFITQPALFVIEYALAKQWMEWGVCPEAMIGHSVGEYVAACLSGVFSLQDALSLVAARGRLMQDLPGGAMLSIPLAEEQVRPMLRGSLSLAAVNGPSLCVVSGPTDAVEALEQQLAEKGVDCRRLHTSHAFHSEMMEAILDPFADEVKKANLQHPQIPYLSNVTGTWITAAEATDPSYWARHLRQTVCFSDGMRRLLKESNWVLLEVGPGRTLSTFARQHFHGDTVQIVLTLLRHPRDQVSDVAVLLDTLGKAWLAGVNIDWPGVYAGERRHRLPLLTYPFERQRYWIEPGEQPRRVGARRASPEKKPDVADWFYIPVWKQSLAPAPWRSESLAHREARWLLFLDGCGLGSQLIKRLERAQVVIAVVAGDQFTRSDDQTYTINPRRRGDYDTLFQELCARDMVPTKIVHLWNVTPNNGMQSQLECFEDAQNSGFYSLLFIGQALAEQSITDDFEIIVVSNDMQEVTGLEALCPEKATLLGPCKVIPQEHPNITCRSIDVTFPQSADWQEKKLIDQLMAELGTEAADLIVVYRGQHRWVQTFEAVKPARRAEHAIRLREAGQYLITGGLQGIALVWAKYLARTVRAKLTLIEHPAFPDRDEWEEWLATHDAHDDKSCKIREVHALEDLGAKVLVVGAEVTDREQMRGAVNQALGRFGEIHGVIYAQERAAEDGSVGTIRETRLGACERQIQSQVYGLLALEEVFRGRELDFCLLQSSLASVLGGVGLIAHTAAALFVNAFVNKHNQTNAELWASVNWDHWQFGNGEARTTAIETTLAELAITPQEGIKALPYVMSMGPATQILISTQDLHARIERWLKRESRRSKDAGVSSPRSRLNLQVAYVAPRNDLERVVAEMWQEVLGVEQVGIYDDFFELGGHSLMATQLTSRLRQAFPVELSLRRLLEIPTVAGLAEVIEEMLMQKLQALSEEEAQSML